MIYNWYYTVNRHKCPHHQKPLHHFLLWLLTQHFQWLRDPRRGFEDNMCMTKILDEQLESKKQKYTGLELKHYKKGIYPSSIPDYTFFHKQPVYKQVALRWKIAKQLSRLSPLSLRKNKNYRLNKSGVFPL